MEIIETESHKNIDLGFILKLLLAIVPVLSLIVAALHYFVLFMSFNGISTSLLTVKDYLDKSVEFIPVVLLFVYVCIISGTFSDDGNKNKLEGLSKEEVLQHYEDHIGRLKKQIKWSKLFSFSCAAILFLLLVFWLPSTLTAQGLLFITILILLMLNLR